MSKKNDDNKLHVSYVPRLLTKRKEKLVYEYIHRFFTPYIFVLWFLVAFDINDCKHMVYIVPILIVVGAAHSTTHKYAMYYKDLVYVMQQDDIEVDEFTKCHFILFEFIIQIMTTFVSFYWTREVEECMFNISRTNQSYLFVIIITITFILHIGHHQQTKKQREHFVKRTYSHVSDIDI